MVGNDKSRKTIFLILDNYFSAFITTNTCGIWVYSIKKVPTLSNRGLKKVYPDLQETGGLKGWKR